jgi:hypothetical protein
MNPIIDMPKLAPHSIQAEQLILGAVLLNASAYRRRAWRMRDGANGLAYARPALATACDSWSLSCIASSHVAWSTGNLMTINDINATVRIEAIIWSQMREALESADSVVTP